MKRNFYENMAILEANIKAMEILTGDDFDDPIYENNLVTDSIWILINNIDSMLFKFGSLFKSNIVMDNLGRLEKSLIKMEKQVNAHPEILDELKKEKVSFTYADLNMNVKGANSLLDKYIAAKDNAGMKQSDIIRDYIDKLLNDNVNLNKTSIKLKSTKYGVGDSKLVALDPSSLRKQISCVKDGYNEIVMVSKHLHTSLLKLKTNLSKYDIKEISIRTEKLYVIESLYRIISRLENLMLSYMNDTIDIYKDMLSTMTNAIKRGNGIDYRALQSLIDGDYRIINDDRWMSGYLTGFIVGSM